MRTKGILLLVQGVKVENGGGAGGVNVSTSLDFGLMCAMCN